MKRLLILILVIWSGVASAQSVLFLNAGPTPQPQLTEVGSFTAFSNTQGTASAAQTVTISGANLISNVTVTAPTGWEVSVDNSTYAVGLTIGVSGGVIPSQPLTVYMRIAAATVAGSYSGNLSFAATNATTINVPATGTVNPLVTRNSHWRTITVPSSNITGGSRLDSFTVTFQGTYSYLKTVSQGGEIKSVVGGVPCDLWFARDNAASSKLKWDIENWDSTTGAITAHVLFDSLSVLSNVVVNLVYDSAGISSYQGGTGPYDSKTAAAYYFNEALSGSSAQTVHDYSGKGLNMTTHGSYSAQQAAGQVGGSITLKKANSDYFTMATQSYTGTYTVEGWYRSPGTPDLTDNWWLNSTDESTLMGINTVFEFFNSCGNAADVTSFSANTWYYIVFTRNGTSSICYRNGTGQTAQATGCNVTFQALAGGFSGGDISQDVIADDIRISTVVRTPGWVAAKYLNQNTPASFYTVGAEN